MRGVSKGCIIVAATCSVSFVSALQIRRDDKAGEDLFLLKADCEGRSPGKTTLIDIAANPKKASDFADLKKTLEWQYSGETIPGTGPPATGRPPERRWSFEFGDALKGTLVIERYIAGDTESGLKCIHGANFSCRYIKHPDDPGSVDFVQMVRISEPFRGLAANTPHIDPYPDRGADDSPFYYRPGDPRNRIVPPPPAGENATVFEDLPEIPYNEDVKHSGFQKFALVLASVSGDRKMKLHEGIEWGWEGGCAPVPEPATWIMLSLAGVGWRKARLKRQGFPFGPWRGRSPISAHRQG